MNTEWFALAFEFSRVLTLAILFFSGCWVWAKLLNNWSIVDAAWAYGFGLICLMYYVFSPEKMHGATLLLIIGVGAWSVRLGSHLALRIFGHLDREDGRYVKMRQEWGSQTSFRMFRFYLLQAFALALLCLPLIAAVIAPAADFKINIINWIGVVILALGVTGETVSDIQLTEFKKAAKSHEVCEVGLWRWSRHPNYFSEWLIWVGFALLSYNSTYFGIPGLICAVIMFLLLTRVTGVPLTEAHLLLSRGAAYRDYQSRVPAFWPKPPRN